MKDAVVDRADSRDDILLIVQPVLITRSGAITPCSLRQHRKVMARQLRTRPGAPGLRSAGRVCGGRADAWSIWQAEAIHRRSRARFLATVYYAGWHHVVEADD